MLHETKPNWTLQVTGPFSSRVAGPHPLSYSTAKFVNEIKSHFNCQFSFFLFYVVGNDLLKKFRSSLKRGKSRLAVNKVIFNPQQIVFGGLVFANFLYKNIFFVGNWEGLYSVRHVTLLLLQIHTTIPAFIWQCLQSLLRY